MIGDIAVDTKKIEKVAKFERFISGLIEKNQNSRIKQRAYYEAVCMLESIYAREKERSCRNANVGRSAKPMRQGGKKT